MKKQAAVSKSLTTVFLVTLALLMIPLVAMQFTDEVQWTLSDFILMGMLLFATGASYVLLTRLAPNWVYRLAVTVALGTTLFLVWANLAVGLIGSGANAGNIMFMLIVLVPVIGSIGAGFKTVGMQRAMYATVSALFVLMIVALLAGMHKYPGSSAVEVVSIGSFFGAFYLFAGLLFQLAGRSEYNQHS